MAPCIMVVKPASSSADVAEDSWASKASMRQARGSFGVAVVNGKIYAIGGSTEKGGWSISSGFFGTGGIVGTNDEYDPATDKWISKSQMPTPRIGFSTIVCQDKIYCMGGNTNKPRVGAPTRTEAVEAYDPATNRWEIKSPMPTRRENFAIIVYQNKIYLIGGTTGRDYITGLPLYTGLNEVYDPSTDTWENKTQMPTAKVANANVVKGKIYFIGGAPNNTLNQVYDPATDSWTIKAPVPTEAFGYSAVIDDKIYFIGGSYSGSQYYTLTQIYDPETGKWSQGAPPPSGGIGFTFVTTGDMAPERIYVLDEALRVYDPETDSWTFGANMPTYRLNLGFALVNDKLYAIGGNTYTYEYLLTQIRGGTVTPYATNEQYTPFGYGTAPPKISVISPENKMYNASDVVLTFTLNRPAVWMGYSLDGQETVTVTGNTTLAGLTNGLHNVTVYAKDAFENTGASDTLSFSVEAPFPTTLIAASIASVAIIGIVLLVYFKKRKR